MTTSRLSPSLGGRAAGSRFRQRVRGELVLDTSDACSELQDQTESQTPQSDVLVLVYEASGDQLRELGSLIDSGAIRPVVDRVFPFESTTEALAYVEKGRAKGKVVVKIR
jgi:NADPH:quinone reductase-like Zn-dependent oxidoreductase